MSDDASHVHYGNSRAGPTSRIASYSGSFNGFITKLNADGSALVYSTFIAGDSFGSDVAVDSAGNAYVVGETTSAGFPTTPGSFQPARIPSALPVGNRIDAFVLKLNPTGSGLVYSTYLGSGDEVANGKIAVDPAGDAYVTGTTIAPSFPTTPGAFQSDFSNRHKTYVAELNPAGSTLVYGTLLGGDGVTIDGIAVDATGHAYVTGTTFESTFPTTPGAFQATNVDNLAAFVTKINPTGTALDYSGYLSGDTYARAIAVDPAGNAYITGETTLPTFPTTPGAFQRTFAGPSDAFVTKLNPAGSAQVYSTYLGGSEGAMGQAIAVDAAGDAYVTGTTNSADFPTTPGVFQPTFGGKADNYGGDAFVTKLSPDGSTLVYSSYLGGSEDEIGTGIALDAAGNAHVIGITSSSNFPLANAFQTTKSGTGGEGGAVGSTFLSKIIPSAQFDSPTHIVLESGGSISVTITRTGDVSTAASVDVATADGTATSGVDYRPVRQTLDFGVGVASKTITITILDDGGSGLSGKTFDLVLTNPIGNLGVGTPGKAAITIVERFATNIAVVTSSPSSIVGQAVTITATVSRSVGTAGTPTGTVTFLDGTTRLGTVPLDDSGHASFTTTTLGAGPRIITATYGGDLAFATSTGLAAQLVTGLPGKPPSVVELQRFGFHLLPTVLVLSFDRPLDPATATDPDNFRINDPSAHRIGLRSISYDPATLSVALRPSHRLNIHLTYHLRVIGAGPSGVRGVDGQLLEGAGAGLPGTNYNAAIDRATLVLPRTLTRTVGHPVGARTSRPRAT